MVLLGFVIEKKDKVFEYINRFREVFISVRASPFSKKPLFDSFYSETKEFKDRIVFVYFGKISAFSFIMFLLRYALAILLMITLFFSIGGLLPVVSTITTILFIIGLLVHLVYSITYSKYGFWFFHLRTFNKKKYAFKKLNKKLLSSSEIFNCLILGHKPLFKNELGD